MFKEKVEKVKMSGKVTPETTGYVAYAFMVPLDSVLTWQTTDGRRKIEASGLPCFVVSHFWEEPEHYHVMVLFDESREAAPVYWLYMAFGGYNLQGVSNPRMYARYMCHLDNPDRHQYSPDDVMCFNGCIYNEFIR